LSLWRGDVGHVVRLQVRGEDAQIIRVRGLALASCDDLREAFLHGTSGHFAVQVKHGTGLLCLPVPEDGLPAGNGVGDGERRPRLAQATGGIEHG